MTSITAGQPRKTRRIRAIWPPPSRLITVRCGHSSSSGSSAFHGGGQAPAEPHGPRRVHREAGRMKPSERTPTWKAARTVRSSPRSRVSQLPAGGMHQSARQHLAHFVALEHTGLLRGVAERPRSKPAGSPAQPAFPRLSTANIYIGGSGRRSWPFGYRGSAAVRPSRSLAVFLVHRRTDSPEEITSGRQLPCLSFRDVPQRSHVSLFHGRSRPFEQRGPTQCRPI